MREGCVRYVTCLVQDKCRSLDIAPLAILDSGTLQPRKRQLTGIDYSTAAQASGYQEHVLTDY